MQNMQLMHIDIHEGEYKLYNDFAIIQQNGEN